jgi:hypothetical protein
VQPETVATLAQLVHVDADLARQLQDGLDDASLQAVLAASPNGQLANGTIKLTQLSDVMPERVQWLWRGRVALAKPTLVEGDPGLGKSLLTVEVAARVSTGRGMPDGLGSDLEGPRGVVLLSAEDGVADTIVPRLLAAGGDPSRVFVLEEVVDGADVRPPLVTDLAAIEHALAEADGALLVIDPLVAHLPPDVNANVDADVRRVLRPLSLLVQQRGAALLMVRHLNKDRSKSALYRGGGSIGFAGAARTVLVVGKHPADGTDTRRVLVPSKTNLAKRQAGLVFEIVADTDESPPHLRWEREPLDITADELLSPTGADQPAPEGSSMADAISFWHEVLKDGPQPSETVRFEAKAAGIAWRTLDRAKSAAGVKSKKDGEPLREGGTVRSWRYHLTPESDGSA